MASRVPVEMWTKIFEEIIDVPEFFSSDPLTEYGADSWCKFRVEGFYWRSEHWRNELRRVHSGWNILLNLPKYRHRFVRISDVTHGQLKEEEIPWEKTLRISFEARPGCGCQKQYNMLYHRWEGSTVCGEPLEEMSGIVARYRLRKDRDKTWRLRIIDCPQESLTSSQVLQALSGIATLTAIKGRMGWDAVAPHARHLRLLNIDFDDPLKADPNVTQGSFPHLTTLAISGFNGLLDLRRLRVPSLQYLQLSSKGGSLTLDKLITGMEAVGDNLQILHCDYMQVTGTIPVHFWKLVPRLTQIRLNCIWMYPPPRDHPLRIVRIHTPTVALSQPDHLVPFYPSHFRRMPAWVLWSASTRSLVGPEYDALMKEWNGRRLRIAMEDIWDPIFFSSQYRERCLFLSQEYDTLGWDFTDATGWTFNTFLVSLLERRKAARMARMWDWIPAGYPRAAPGSLIQWQRVRRKRLGNGDRGILEAEFSTSEPF